MATEGKTQVEMVGDLELVAIREFDAPRELVWRAWTEAEQLMQWWGPREWPTQKCTVDLRVGGVWHYCMVGPDGTEAWGIATYQEISAPERLVYEDAFSDAERTIVPPVTTVSIELEDLGDGRTRQVGRSIFASAEDRTQVLDMGMVEGMSETLDRLEELLAQ